MGFAVLLLLLRLCLLLQAKPVEEATIQAEAQALRVEFMSLMRQLFDSQLDSSSFEDACRSLLGTNSYVLFTLDKLVLKFVKHIQVRACWMGKKCSPVCWHGT
jgi:hypothetical protein